MTRNNSHRRIVGGWAVGFLALLSTVGFATAAQAAPKYQDSEPGAGSSVQTAPDTVSITFSEPLDESSTMAVRNSCGDGVDGGNVTVDLNEMRVSITEGHYSGTYKVSYTAEGIGGVTGKDAGTFTFNVAEGHPCDDGGGKKHPPNHDPKKHDPNEHDPKEHDPGKDGHGDKHGDGDHQDQDHDGTDHSGTGHSDSGHSGTSSHDSMSGPGHSSTEHGNGNGNGDHDKTSGGHGDHGNMDDNKGSAKGTFASGPLPRLPADGQAALIALVLCAAMGVIGGMFLRSSVD